MKRDDDSLLDPFRTPGPCERCLKWCDRREPHHAFIKRGMGGATTINEPENIIALCRPCHDWAEHKLDVNEHCRDIIAQRVGQPKRVILGWLHSIVRADKNGPCPERPWLKEKPEAMPQPRFDGVNLLIPDPQNARTDVYIVEQLACDPSIGSKAFRLWKADGVSYDVVVRPWGPECQCWQGIKERTRCKHVIALRKVGAIRS